MLLYICGFVIVCMQAGIYVGLYVCWLVYMWACLFVILGFYIFR